MSQHDLASA